MEGAFYIACDYFYHMCGQIKLKHFVDNIAQLNFYYTLDKVL